MKRKIQFKLQSCLSLLFFLVLNQTAISQNCVSSYTLISDELIDITNPSSFGTNFSNGSGNNLNITKDIIVPDGVTLTIKGTTGNILNVNFPAKSGIKVQKGGLLIIDYCSLSGSGACPADPFETVTTWNGIRVNGDPNEEHYESYDLVNGWDPYADPFVPGGQYKQKPGGIGLVHGRAQIRFSSFSGIYTEGSTGLLNDHNGNTPYLREDMYGNYAIRSHKGGILNIIDCDFSDVKTAILIDNYTQYPTGDPESSLMNAFQIVDCEFNVSSSQRSSVHDFRFCIEMYEAQKATIEGCVFNSNDFETFNSNRGTAIYMVNSSLLMHKSGNFRRSQDFSSIEATEGCPKYGAEMDWTGKNTNHPWYTITPEKCEFNNFNRAIDAIGQSSSDPLHTLALDDIDFNNTYFTIRCKKMVGTTISRSDFSFDESSANFNVVNEKPLVSNDQFRRMGHEDRVDVTLDDCENSLITECSFSSNYNGISTQTGKNVYIQIFDLPNGDFSQLNLELIYKNTFSPSNHGEDIGVWLSKESGWPDPAYVLFNCNTFENLECAIFIGQIKTMLCNQFHHTDIGGGRNAAAQNTFIGNDCDFDAYEGYNGNSPATYHRLSTEPIPSDCEGNGIGNSIISDQTTSEDPQCISLTCVKFPMRLSTGNEIDSELATIYPNPNNGNFTVQLNRPLKNARLSIIDLTGKVVYEKQILDELRTFPVQVNLPSGYYGVVLTTSNAILSKKLIIE